jgi:uncharacterized protein (DUF433 family)
MEAPVLHILVDSDGVARTINQGVKVKMIAQKIYVAGEKVEAVADHYGLDVADVYAALTYYHDNRAAYEAEARELEPLIAAGIQHSTALKARIQARIDAKDDTAE